MSSLFRFLVLPLTLLLTLTVSGCGGGGGDSGSDLPPQLGTLKLTIVDASSDPLTGIADANILLLDGTGDPVKNYTSGTDGIVIQENLATGSYQLKVSAQGFSPSPAPRVPPLPVKILDNYQTTSITIMLNPLDSILSLGAITGTVSDNTASGVAGALIVADTLTESYTTISAADGSYILHNVPAGTVSLTAFTGGFNFPTLPGVTVVTDETTIDQNIEAISIAGGSVTGNVNFVAGGGAAQVDVSLLHPETREVIPGVRVYTNTADSHSYAMTGIPDGHFEIIASLENDGIVIDPDESVTQGVPTVDVNAGVATPLVIDFKATGAVELDTPATPTNNIVPVLSTTPSFTWHQASSYSNVDEYVFEVVNESGDTIWGGFDTGTGLPNTTPIAKADPITIDYDFDGTASTPLEVGHYYQLRIYASKNDVNAPNGLGFKLVSSTETLDGVFKVE